MDDARFDNAIAAFDAYHRRDPGKELVDGEELPAELVYAIRMTERLRDFAPNAPEYIRLASRCQHIGRWEIPRTSYPMDRKGYLLWRNTMKQHHADRAEQILGESGYDHDIIEKVKFLVLKKQLFSHPDTQLLEDVVCLVFIEHYLRDFAARHDDQKVVDILQKTLKKMSSRAKVEAMKIRVADPLKPLIAAAAGT